jgi:hypothetical protein
MASIAGARADWRRRMRGELFWIFLAKLAALTLLWMLFFSTHRAPIDRDSVSHQLGVVPSAAPARSPPTPFMKEISRG